MVAAAKMLDVYRSEASATLQSSFVKILLEKGRLEDIVAFDSRFVKLMDKEASALVRGVTIVKRIQDSVSNTEGEKLCELSDLDSKAGVRDAVMNFTQVSKVLAKLNMRTDDLQTAGLGKALTIQKEFQDHLVGSMSAIAEKLKQEKFDAKPTHEHFGSLVDLAIKWEEDWMQNSVGVEL